MEVFSDFPVIIFGIFIVLFIVVFIVQVFTKKGRKSAIEIALNAAEATPIAELEAANISPKYGLGAQYGQNIVLYKCLGDEGVFYVLEYSQKSLMAGFHRNYIKLTPQMLEQIFTAIKDHE